MQLLIVLLAGLYVLPDAGQLPAPNAAQKVRIDRALKVIAEGDGEEVDVAVRDLALVGEPALARVLDRLNEAEAGERLVLLAAVKRMPRAKPLLEQAHEDPHPAVRAWAAGPPKREPPDLRLLASRYLELLAVAEQKQRDDADEDLKAGVNEEFGRPRDTLEGLRERMRDRVIALAIQAERKRVANRFAKAGGAALRAGTLKPDLSDPIFVAYVALLREESIFYPLGPLVSLGERAVPAFTTLLDRENHEPRKIVRILCSLRTDRGRGLYDRFDAYRPDAQRALVVLAAEVLEPGPLLKLLEHAALAEDGTVRAVALDELLKLDPPAGVEPARKLLDPARYGRTEFPRAARLLARAGELELLEQYASLALIPKDAPQLSNAAGAARSALRGAPGAEAVGERLLESSTDTVRMRGVDLVRDRKKLIALAAREQSPKAVARIADRLLDLDGPEEEALALLTERQLDASMRFIGKLRARGRLDLVVKLAVEGAPAEQEIALGVLSNLAELDAKFESALLALYDGTAPVLNEEPKQAVARAALRRKALAAILPLGGTPEVVKRFVDARENALLILFGRVEDGLTIPFAFPLRPFLDGADDGRLKQLGRIGEGLGEVEPGLYRDLLRAWNALPAGEDRGEGLDEGAAHHKIMLLKGLEAARDPTSAESVFDDVVAGRIEDAPIVMAALAASARHLPPNRLEALIPILRKLAAEEHPDERKEAPPYSQLRAVLLRGGFNALAYRQSPKAPALLCDLLLDPLLYAHAFDWKLRSNVPYWCRDALREFSKAQVKPAFEAALLRAEADGRLARMHPQDLFDTVQACRNEEGRGRGRKLDEIGLALCDVLDRLPFDGEVGYERMLALGGLNRFAEAAAAARADAAAKRARGFGPFDGFWTAERMDRRAELYEGLATRDAKQIAALIDRTDDHYILNLAAWYLRFMVVDLAEASRAAEKAVRATSGLYHPYRDTLATIRNAQGRPDEAVRLLDPRQHLPVRRQVTSRWFMVYLAQAYLLRGDEVSARHQLELGLGADRRILPSVRRDPTFARFAAVFRYVDREFFFSYLFGFSD